MAGVSFVIKFIIFCSLITINALLIWPTLVDTEDLNSQLKACTRPKMSEIGKVFLISFASIIVPSGYSNDEKMLHPRIKGGVYLILNYLVTMILMGISLAFTMKEKIPLIISGVPLPQAPMKIEHSDLSAKTYVAGFGVSIFIPGNQVSTRDLKTDQKLLALAQKLSIGKKRSQFLPYH